MVLKASTLGIQKKIIKERPIKTHCIRQKNLVRLFYKIKIKQKKQYVFPYT